MAAPKRIEVRTARQRLFELEREFELIVERYNAVNERVELAQVQMAESQLRINELERSMSASEEAAVVIARELYMGGPTASLEAFFSSETLAQLESRVAYLNATRRIQLESYGRLVRERQRLALETEELDRAIATRLDARTQVADLIMRIEAKVASQEKEIAELNQAIEAARRRRERRLQRAGVAAPQPYGSPNIREIMAEASNPQASIAVRAALAQLGKPYQWGAEGPDSFDCSGLSMWAWSKAGVEIPRVSRDQFALLPHVERSDWQAGDLLFFGSPIHHLGMYLGDGKMVEAPYTGAFVRISSAFRSDYAGAARPGV